MAKLIEKNYGQALFDLSVEQNQVDAYADQISMILQALDENPDLLALLTHPQINKEDKINVVENIFAGRVDDDITGFLVIVVKAGRQNALREILEYFMNEVKAYKHIGVAYVTSAVELSETQKAAVKKRLLDTTDEVDYEMHYHVDPSLIGGMIIRIGDKVVDSSIKTKLELMSRDLLKIQI